MTIDDLIIPPAPGFVPPTAPAILSPRPVPVRLPPHPMCRVKYRNRGRPPKPKDERLRYQQVGMRGPDYRRMKAVWAKLKKDNPEYKKLTPAISHIFLRGLDEIEADLKIMEAAEELARPVEVPESE